jgi:hypothetical protein
LKVAPVVSIESESALSMSAWSDADAQEVADYEEFAIESNKEGWRRVLKALHYHHQAQTEIVDAGPPMSMAVSAWQLPADESTHAAGQAVAAAYLALCTTMIGTDDGSG